MTIDEIISTILKNRGIETPEQVEDFLHPKHPSEIPSPFDSKPAIGLINKHIAAGNKIFVYGDYDVDGICSTALLWETLYQMPNENCPNGKYTNVLPHIPHRRTEGYGLSRLGVDHCLSQGAKLIIAVDNGIVAHDVIDYCRSRDCDVIIIDHHEQGDKLPNANVVLHSSTSCAAGLTWFFCRDFKNKFPSPESGEGQRVRFWESLELVTLATICDQVPLIGTNRSFVVHGLKDLNQTTRPGLRALFEEAGLLTTNIRRSQQAQQLTTYHVGFIIGPRLNASGRLEHAIDSLRLLCTKDENKARDLAQVLGDTNRSRQELTESAVAHALSQMTNDKLQMPNLIAVSDQSYDEGIIGLIAAKLVEKFHKPAVAISVGPDTSKGSARSIPGFNITDHLRKFSDLLLGVGGHAAAAGFSLTTSDLPAFKEAITHPDIAPELLVKSHKYDLEIPLSIVNFQLSTALKTLEPFGLGNPKPVFLTKNVEINDPKKIGKLGNHLKFQVENLDAIYFNFPSPYPLDPNPFNIIYSLDENIWNDQTRLQLMIKEIKNSLRASGGS